MHPASELESSVSRTACSRSRSGTLRTLLGLFGAPVAWLAQLMFSEPLVAHACYPYQEPLSAPMWEGLPVLLAAVSIICLAVALLSGIVAWSSWRSIKCRPAETNGVSVELSQSRSRFLAKLSLMSSFIFIMAVIFNACALFLVPLCGSWF